MEQKINSPFLYFNKQKVFSMDEIKWWLLKYSDLYKTIHNFVSSQHLFELEDGSIVRLPPFGEPTADEKFLDLYQELDKISEFHRKEKYFEQELSAYKKIKHSKTDLTHWIEKNKKLVAKEYACFLVDYLDYSEIAEHLNIFVPLSKELDIYVSRQDFENTIHFLEVYSQPYKVKDF